MNILEELKKTLKSKGVNKSITPQTNFKDLGLDSLDLMDLIIDAEKKLNILIPDEKLNEITAVEDLIKIIEQLKNN